METVVLGADLIGRASVNLGIHVSWEDSALYVELGGSEAYLKYLHLKSASDPCKDRTVVQMQSASSWGSHKSGSCRLS